MTEGEGRVIEGFQKEKEGAFKIRAAIAISFVGGRGEGERRIC
jgi:hypothetical protein